MNTRDLTLDMPIDGLQLIEASAGTGKTWTLAGLYLRFVVERRRAVGEILAVTFTEAATQELKRRLRERLVDCAALASAEVALTAAISDSAEAAQAKTLLARALDAGETRAQLARRLRLAALDVDHASITTINGFCRRALAEYGLLAGRALAGTLVAQDRDLVETATADWWRGKATAAAAADFDVLREAFKTPQALAKVLDSLLPGTRRLLPAIDGGDRAVALLHQALDAVRERVVAAKRATARHSHDDEIRELHGALAGENGAELAARLHARCPVALIDEFQDTDARQFAIFESIYVPRGDLILIGDPKQAIYGFRGGDVHTYLRAQRRVAERQTLTRNFRSTPTYLRALNALYRGAGKRAFEEDDIVYEALQPGGKAADDDLLIDGVAATPLTLWCDTDAAIKRSSKDAARAQLAAACAAGIFALLTPGRARLREKPDGAHAPLRPAHIAVLVAMHEEARAVQDALRTRGIASASITRSSVFASEEAGELHRLLDALADFDEARLRGVLTTRLFGATMTDFAGFVAAPHTWSDQLAWLAELRDIWRARGVAAMLARVFEVHAAALLGLADGERRMTNWLQLAELAQTASIDCVGLRGLVDWLAARIAQADDNNEDEQLRLESDAGRVQIFTYHKSKGLQFPVVFLPFTGMRGGAPKPPYRFHDGEGNPALFFAANAEAAATPAALAACVATAHDDLAEELRKLYVALTRACCATFACVDAIGSRGEEPALLHLLGVAPAGGTKDAAATDAQLASRLAALRASAAGAIAIETLPAAAATRLADTREAAKPGTVRRMPRALRDDWRIVSYSRLAAGARDDVRADRSDEGASAPVDGAASVARSAVLGGARFGTAFHELIEVADFRAWRDRHPRNLPPGEDARIDRILQRHALDADAAEAHALLADLLARTLNAPLPFGARLADLAAEACRAEMPFHFSIGHADTARWLALLHEHGYVRERGRFELARLEGLMTGVLDLVLFHAGRWWVIDYKTNILPDTGDSRPYAATALAAAVRDKEYDLQYLIYLTALHRWLKSRDPGYDYARDIGGALYLFVRGLDARGVDGVHVDTPPAALIEAIDALLAPAAEAAA
ncbi:MAG: UvrD-helicase domain-containing protein [Proteobacteria bacterium]|nr:UvrD-helicase domain-containing protein [Pseudomonadota bacterium]